MMNEGEAQYLGEIGKYPLLSADEERVLANRIRDGDSEARDELVCANLRLVVFVAKKYVDRGLSLLDLIQEGNLGLLGAVDSFDPDKGCKLSTHATWWIKRGIRRALVNKVRSIRLPSYVVDLVARWKRTAARLAQEKGREPFPDEVAAALDLSPQQLATVLHALKIVERPEYDPV